MTFLTHPQAIEITATHASLDYGTSDTHETRLYRYYWPHVADSFHRVVRAMMHDSAEYPRIQITRIRLVPLSK